MCLIKNNLAPERPAPYPQKCMPTVQMVVDQTNYPCGQQQVQPTQEDLGPESRSRCSSWSVATPPMRFQEPPSNSNDGDDDFSYDDLNPAPRNPWGDMSYGDLIASAIRSSPERRMLLSQIYDWMMEHVAYFAERADKETSTGWKNSVRHNLSLHKKFLRVNNEVPGMPSWWVINPARRQRGCKGGVPRKASADKTLSMKEEAHSYHHNLSNNNIDEEAERKVAEIKASLKQEQAGQETIYNWATQPQAPQKPAKPVTQNPATTTAKPSAASASGSDRFLNDDELTATLQSLFPDFKDSALMPESPEGIDSFWSLSPGVPLSSCDDDQQQQFSSVSSLSTARNSIDCNFSSNSSNCSGNSPLPATTKDRDSKPPAQTPVQWTHSAPSVPQPQLTVLAPMQSSSTVNSQQNQLNQSDDFIELVSSVPQKPNQINYETYLKLMKTLGRPVVLCDMCHAIVCHSAPGGHHHQ